MLLFTVAVFIIIMIMSNILLYIRILNRGFLPILMISEIGDQIGFSKNGMPIKLMDAILVSDEPLRVSIICKNAYGKEAGMPVDIASKKVAISDLVIYFLIIIWIALFYL